MSSSGSRSVSDSLTSSASVCEVSPASFSCDLSGYVGRPGVAIGTGRLPLGTAVYEGDHAAGIDMPQTAVHGLRLEVKSSQPAMLPELADKVTELTDAICWAAVQRSDVTLFRRCATAAAALGEFIEICPPCTPLVAVESEGRGARARARSSRRPSNWAAAQRAHGGRCEGPPATRLRLPLEEDRGNYG